MALQLAFVKQLIANYKQNHWPTIDGSCPSLRQNPNYLNGVTDARSVWYDINLLQAFFKSISLPLGPSGAAVPCDGIRAYYGEYSPSMVTDFGIDPQLIGLHTLVLVPTIAGGAGVHIDFDFASNNPLSAITDDTAFVSVMNHGSLAPPPFDVTATTYAAVCGACLLDL